MKKRKPEEDVYTFITEDYFYSIEPEIGQDESKGWGIYRGNRLLEVKATQGEALSALLEAIGPGTYKKL